MSARTRSSKPKTMPLTVYVTEETVAAINAYRRKQESPPDISKAVRELIALAVKGKVAA
jgi:hypothetical protein